MSLWRPWGVETTIRRRQLQYLMVRALVDCDVRSLIKIAYVKSFTMDLIINYFKTVNQVNKWPTKLSKAVRCSQINLGSGFNLWDFQRPNWSQSLYCPRVLEVTWRYFDIRSPKQWLSKLDMLMQWCIYILFQRFLKIKKNWQRSNLVH